MNTSNDVVAAWKAWVSEKNTPRRKMIVQIINALRLSYAWQAYDKAVGCSSHFARLGSSKLARISLSEA
jgi:hypothetical protein